MSRQIIVAGSGNLTTEIYETAVLLGFDVLILDLIGNSQIIAARKIKPSDVTEDLRKIPIIMGTVNYPEFEKLNFLELSRKNREKLYTEIINLGFKNWVSIIHPSAVVSPSAKIAMNVFVNANSTISSNSVIAENSRINRNVSIGHDVSIGAFCDIAPGVTITGAVQIEDSVFIGAGSVLIHGLRVGKGSSVGAGALVTRSVDDFTLVMGSPARKKNQGFRAFRKRVLPKILKLLKALKLHKTIKRVTRR